MRSIFAFIKSIFTKILDFFRIRGVGPVIVDPDEPSPFDPGEVVCYYGCPNSKKAKKLQLNKKLYR
ncbi:MAG: hypothetical protein IJK89_02765 [Clostridia bacterium]|nr:hypothetical protein [Clostridia bacterium]